MDILQGRSMRLEVRPAEWTAFNEVMGEKGGCGGCWCMLWRLSRKAWESGAGESNRDAMKALFQDGRVPGLIGWIENEPVGWIQVDERIAFPRLANSRILKPIDNAPVWSIACFFIKKEFRRKGASIPMLRAACDFAAENGARIIEGYPIDTAKERYPSVYAWTGFLSSFRSVGFEEVARRSPTRPIMRKRLMVVTEPGGYRLG